MAGRIEHAAFAAALVVSSACGSNAEGILLVISADQGIKYDTLQIGLGGPLDDVIFDIDDNTGYSHVHDILEDGDFQIGLRDLGADPYRYFISGEGAGELDVVVAAYRHEDEQTVEVAAAIQQGLTSGSGVVHEYEIRLEPAELMAKEPSCTRVFMADGNGEVFLTANTDFDCDTYEEDGPPGEADCFPFNGNFHPGAEDFCEFLGQGIDGNCNGLCDESDPDADNGVTSCGTNVDAVGDDFLCTYDCPDGAPGGRRTGEICDGFDSDCNPNTLPHDASTGCFAAREGAGCFFGSTSCEDQGGLGTGDAENCAASDVNRFVVPDELCDKYNEPDCLNSNEAYDCALGKVSDIETVTCLLPVLTEGNQPCPFKVRLEAGRNQEPCELTILDPRQAPFATAQLAPAAGCDADFLELAPGQDGEASSFELLLKQTHEDNDLHLVRVIVNAMPVEQCSNDAGTLAICDKPVIGFPQ